VTIIMSRILQQEQKIRHVYNRFLDGSRWINRKHLAEFKCYVLLNISLSKRSRNTFSAR
jgi:hypothetical protein